MSEYTTPEWVHHAVFYQIFPERFCNGNPFNNPENVSHWGTMPTPTNYMGGDLQGVIDKLDYLNDLGITAIYLTPIFHALSNHKYNTYNYFAIDPHFGTLETFHMLITQAHRRDMRVILDGVFNHCGRGFFAFQSVLEQQHTSPYCNWFHITQLPLNPYDEEEEANYACWWNIRSLPKFNIAHRPVRDYLLAVARYWLEQGADGWRLDVPNEIADHTFWHAFRTVVKKTKPDAYIVGELWGDATEWLDGTQFDGAMNYLFRDLVRDFFARQNITPLAFADGIDALLAMYPLVATHAQLNLLGSHDTARFITEANGHSNRLYPAILFQMSFPGAPCIYYGDEIGMQGAKDPYCRGAFPWNERHWDVALHAWVKQCIALRHAHPALRTGTYQLLVANNETRMVVFARSNTTESLVVALNPTNTPQPCSVPLDAVPALQDGTTGTNLLDNTIYTVKHRRLFIGGIPAWGGAVVCFSRT